MVALLVTLGMACGFGWLPGHQDLSCWQADKCAACQEPTLVKV